MIKQIDRVIGDLTKQVKQFHQRSASTPICVGIVGINQATQYTSFEGDRSYPTDGKKYKHPIDEAEEAERRIINQVAPHYDELLILKFIATNEDPFDFSWTSHDRLHQEYGAALVRISNLYEKRFARNH